MKKKCGLYFAAFVAKAKNLQHYPKIHKWTSEKDNENEWLDSVGVFLSKYSHMRLDTATKSLKLIALLLPFKRYSRFLKQITTVQGDCLPQNVDGPNWC